MTLRLATRHGRGAYTARRRRAKHADAVPCRWPAGTCVVDAVRAASPARSTRRCAAFRRSAKVAAVLPSFEATVSALTYSIIRARCGDASTIADERYNRVARFVLARHAGMPDYLRLPFALATVGFGLAAVAFAGRRFHRLPHERRWSVVDRWRALPLGVARDLIRFYESLVVFGWFTLEHGGELA